MKPNQFFEEIYCINLSRRDDRWEKVQRRFRRENLTVTRFQAIDGMHNDITNDYRDLCRNLPENTLNTTGAYAIVLTYISLFKKILEKKQQQVLIFEDDVLFHIDFKALFNEQVEKLPQDWLMWSLGSSQYGWNNITYTEDRKFYSPKLPDRTYGLFAFGIKKEYIEEMIPILETMLRPADVDIYKRSSGIYISNPSICGHDNGYSDNTNCLLDVNVSNPRFSNGRNNRENYW